MEEMSLKSILKRAMLDEVYSIKHGGPDTKAHADAQSDRLLLLQFIFQLCRTFGVDPMKSTATRVTVTELRPSRPTMMEQRVMDALKKMEIEYCAPMEEIVHSRSCFSQGIQIPGHENVCTCGADESLSPMPWD